MRNDVKNQTFSYRANKSLQFSYDVAEAISSITDSRALDLSKLAPNCDHLQLLADISEQIRTDFNHLVVIGIGGAISNPLAIAALQHIDDEFAVHFLDSLDLYNIALLHKRLEIKKTAFLVISKSGNTLETLYLVDYWVAHLEQLHIFDPAKFYCIIGAGYNILRRKAVQYNFTTLAHVDITGRYASFSNVMLLVGMVMNLDMQSFAAGAEYTLCNFSTLRQQSLVAQTANDVLALYHSGYSISVCVTYLQQLENLLSWHSQIIAEGLGKSGRGITPIVHLAPQVQHSHFQLYLEGPKNKFFTFFAMCERQGNLQPELIAASFRATFQACNNLSIPMRVFELKKLDEFTVGALMMHFVLESFVLGECMKVDPFSQPAVQHIKDMAATILKD